jgi:hypothetical protein
MVLAFMMASLMPWVHNKSGFYLVLGSSNVDEGLRGYLTKVSSTHVDFLLDSPGPCWNIGESKQLRDQREPSIISFINPSSKINIC